MKIYIFPRTFFEEIKGSDVESFILSNYNIISINTPEYKPKNIVKEDPPFSEKYWNNENVLILYFHDWTSQIDDLVQLISEDDVKNIIEFISNMDQQKDLIIHCTAGISRSGAIGSCLNHYFNSGSDNMMDYKDFVDRHPHIHPNILVFQKLYYQLMDLKKRNVQK